MVDVVTEVVIARSRGEVAAYVSDPDNAMVWYENIKSVEWKSQKPLEVGSRIAFSAQFLGRRLSYTYEVSEIVRDERFVMTTAERPFGTVTTYTWGGHPRRRYEDGAWQPRCALRFLQGCRTDDGDRDAPREPQGPGETKGHPGGIVSS